MTHTTDNIQSHDIKRKVNWIAPLSGAVIKHTLKHDKYPKNSQKYMQRRIINPNNMQII